MSRQSEARTSPSLPRATSSFNDLQGPKQAREAGVSFVGGEKFKAIAALVLGFLAGSGRFRSPSCRASRPGVD